jgi:hypothetical protein
VVCGSGSQCCPVDGNCCTPGYCSASLGCTEPAGSQPAPGVACDDCCFFAAAGFAACATACLEYGCPPPFPGCYGLYQVAIAECQSNYSNCTCPLQPSTGSAQPAANADHDASYYYDATSRGDRDSHNDIARNRDPNPHADAPPVRDPNTHADAPPVRDPNTHADAATGRDHDTYADATTDRDAKRDATARGDAIANSAAGRDAAAVIAGP